MDLRNHYCKCVNYMPQVHLLCMLITISCMYHILIHTGIYCWSWNHACTTYLYILACWPIIIGPDIACTHLLHVDGLLLILWLNLSMCTRLPVDSSYPSLSLCQFVYPPIYIDGNYCGSDTPKILSLYTHCQFHDGYMTVCIYSSLCLIPVSSHALLALQCYTLP